VSFHLYKELLSQSWIILNHLDLNDPFELRPLIDSQSTGEENREKLDARYSLDRSANSEQHERERTFTCPTAVPGACCSMSFFELTASADFR
jgi:hypothetical protein